MDDYYRQRIREMVADEDREKQKKVLTSFERFKEWLSWWGEIIKVVKDLWDVFHWVRKLFGY